MKLLIDVGNTTTVVKTFKDNQYTKLIGVNSKNIDEIKKELAKLNLKDYEIAIMSCVVPEIGEIIKEFFNQHHFKLVTITQLVMDYNQQFNFKNPEQVGDDFVANFLAIKNDYSNAIVVSLGTASTFLVVKNSLIMGVIIAPGLSISLDALINSASLLDNQKFSYSNEIIGTNTIQAINLGAINGHWLMLEGQLNNLKSLFENEPHQVIITGGNAHFLEEPIKNSTYLLDYDLIFKGLNYEFKK